MNWQHSLLGTVLALGTAATLAHGDAAHPPGNTVARFEQKPWGIAGDRSKAVRTIEIRMTDDMRFTPAVIQVRQGEIIRLVHHNRGRLMHEFVMGTREELAAHAALMKKFPNMEHDEPYMAHVRPGQRAEMIWHFNRAGDFEFACLLPGHFDAGMIGKIRVVAR